MSSEISTEQPPLKADTSGALQPWQFFVLAALGCATAATFMARGRGLTAIVLLSVMMACAALVGMAVLRALRPLVSPEEDRTIVIGKRTRAALERDKTLALRAIKDLDFDRAMGKLSESDWKEMSMRLRARAARLMRQLDAGEGYRAQIERELEKRLADAGARLKPSRYEGADKDPDDRSAKALADDRSAKALAEHLCASCSTANDADARFCKNCGNKL